MVVPEPSIHLKDLSGTSSDHFLRQEQASDGDGLAQRRWRSRGSFSRPLLTNTNGTTIDFAADEAVGGGPSLLFRDGRRSVDFVLVWDKLQARSLELSNVRKREIFEKNLLFEGLELEYEKPLGGLFFVKIHAPTEVLRRYVEILKLRLPMREIHQKIQDGTSSIVSNWQTFVDNLMKGFVVDETVFPTKKHRFTAVYSRDREYLFDVDAPGFFSPAIHSRVVQFILDRQRFSDDKNLEFAFGIERLITDCAYLAAYPLHDGELTEEGCQRHLLYKEWGNVGKIFRYQPLDYVKDYFGVKIALYFAWLGFYTHMLLPAALVGLVCFIYSCYTLNMSPVTQDICDNSLGIMMCPLCDNFCDYWNLKETCLHAKVTYLTDNSATVFFAIFMSFWGALFLELWKRYSAEMTHRWDLTGFDMQEEHPRPQYLARLRHVKKQQVNIVTNTWEPHVPFWRVRFPATMLSFSIVILLSIYFVQLMFHNILIPKRKWCVDCLLWLRLGIIMFYSLYKVAMAVVAVIGVVLYRMSVLAALSVYGDKVSSSYAILFTTATAASINLCAIVLFNWMYSYLAGYLTELELLRTQTEFDDSLTLKIYLLQFVNYYASIFYIAFFKGKYIGYPGAYKRLFGYRQEECGPGGCLMELCIQLGIIMVGKQAVNTALEMFFPLIFKWLNLRWFRSTLRGKSSLKETMRWMRDLRLLEWGSRGLFSEYLEMVLQYGFVTIFVAAFPLAPFFALLNNIFEMRLDAKKLLTFYRRPVTQRVRDIGVWFKILNSIGKLSIITNGVIIAFTSEFIPRLVYRFHVSEDQSLNGYLNHSLAYFNVTDFAEGSAPQKSQYNVSYCRYQAYREPPWSEKSYEHTNMYWHVLAARLAFVVVFENLVLIVMVLVKWCVPDVPAALRDQIRREAYITNEIIIEQEMLRARRAEATPLPQYKDEPFFTHHIRGKTATTLDPAVNIVASSL